MRPRPHPKLISLVVFAAAAAVLGIAVWPQAVGAERLTLFAYSTALRAPVLVVLVIAAVSLGVLVLMRRRGRRFLVPIAVACALAAVANGAVLVDRGFSSATSASPVDRSAIRVLSWNTEHAAPGSAAIADLIVEVGADLAVLPETDGAAVSEVAAALEVQGLQVTHDTVDHDGYPGSTPTSIVFIGELAEDGYEHDATLGSTPGQPSGVWRAADDASPVVSAVHTVPPMPWATPLWSAGLDWVAARCVEPHAIVAGDFNATLDHIAGLDSAGQDLGRCRDAAAETGSAALGTWPSDLPELLASPIDHILVGSAWRIVSYEVLEAESAPGSDHRPILSVIEPAR